MTRKKRGIPRRYWAIRFFRGTKTVKDPYEYYGDTRTVDVHIRHLRSKLAGAPEIAAAIETVRGVGYRFQYDESRPHG